ncbi:MAG: inorganic diphosphatase [Salibacteraceae bacterium]
MVKNIILSFSIILTQCNSKKSGTNIDIENHQISSLHSSSNRLKDYENIEALIEIPAGTVDKWEFDKATGEMSRELINNKPRVIDYLGYPGNYGMIPNTLLSKENGGDGDPLDVIILGPPAKKGQFLNCKLIGVLHLKDNGETDDKLIAISYNSSLSNVNNIAELNKNYNGITEIIQLWFTNYKGGNKLKSNGFGEKESAINILNNAMKEYQISKKPK